MLPQALILAGIITNRRIVLRRISGRLRTRCPVLPGGRAIASQTVHRLRCRGVVGNFILRLLHPAVTVRHLMHGVFATMP